MVKPNELPKTYEDLLNPRWKGQMMWSTSPTSGAPLFVGNILLTMGDKAGKNVSAEIKNAGYREQHGGRQADTRSRDCRRISAGADDLQPSRAHQQDCRRAVGVATAGAGAGDYQHGRPSEEFAASSCGDAVLDFLLSRAGQKVFQSVNYLPAHPAMPALQADLKVGSGRFQKAKLHQPGPTIRKEQRVG